VDSTLNNHNTEDVNDADDDDSHKDDDDDMDNVHADGKV
jgi:hypothetical protein